LVISQTQSLRGQLGEVVDESFIDTIQKDDLFWGRLGEGPVSDWVGDIARLLLN